MLVGLLALGLLLGSGAGIAGPDGRVAEAATGLSPVRATPGSAVIARGAGFPWAVGRLAWAVGPGLTELRTDRQGRFAAESAFSPARATPHTVISRADGAAPRTAFEVTAAPDTKPWIVKARVETAPVPHAGDAADDPAIWLHPTDPSKSAIIGTDKLGGLAVYDLAGAQLAYYRDGMPNNVDLRYNFPLGGERVALVVTSDTSTDRLRAYRVDPDTRRLVDVAARPLEVGLGVAGLCLYVSPRSGRYYAFVGDSSGNIQQWRFFDDGNGRVDATKVRTLALGSTTEGCVADDEAGHLYVAEEDVAIWRYGAEPGAGRARTRVDAVGRGGRLTADVEGLALYYGLDGGGYLLASSQGSDTFAVYQRRGGNAFVASFTVAAGRVDGVSYTDGIDVTNAGLGAAFPAGVFIAQDNQNGERNQNFKLVPWGAIARSAGLLIDPDWDPRRVGA